jgi:hypothetical protein
MDLGLTGSLRPAPRTAYAAAKAAEIQLAATGQRYPSARRSTSAFITGCVDPGGGSGRRIQEPDLARRGQHAAYVPGFALVDVRGLDHHQQAAHGPLE